MAVHSLIAAKKVCQVRDWAVTNLEINKILYLGHMAMLGRSDGRSLLVIENFQAWDYGPVLPSVYHRTKAFGDDYVQDVFHAFPDIHGTPESDIIEEAVGALSNMRPGQLIANTHWKGGAWAKFYRAGARGIIIPNDAILEEYRDRVS
jgi:uncharacterized phage-associated protein